METDSAAGNVPSSRIESRTGSSVVTVICTLTGLEKTRFFSANFEPKFKLRVTFF